MSNLPDKDFTAAVINKFTEWKGCRSDDGRYDDQVKLSREINKEVEIIKRNQMEILGLKITINT